MKQEEAFVTIQWRKDSVTPHVTHLVQVLQGELQREEMQNLLELKDREHFRRQYLLEAIEQGMTEMTQPDKSRSVNQNYRLTAKGKTLQQKLKKNKRE